MSRETRPELLQLALLVAVAQLVERKLVELDVAGSIPVGHPSFLTYPHTALPLFSPNFHIDKEE